MSHKPGQRSSATEIIGRVTTWNILTLATAGAVSSIVLAIGGQSRNILSVFLGLAAVAIMHVVSFLIERYVLSRGVFVGAFSVLGYIVKIGVILLVYVVAQSMSVFHVKIVVLALVLGILAGPFTGASVIMHDDGPPIGE